MTRAGTTGHPLSGGFSIHSFPLGWKPVLVSSAAHTTIVFLLKPVPVLGIKENRLCPYWVWASGGFIFQ